MEKNIEHQLKVYRMLEKLCTTHVSAWDSCKEFSSAFTRFSAKAAQVQMLAYNHSLSLQPVLIRNERSVVINPAQLNANMQLLALEIDDLLAQMLRALEKECPDQQAFLVLFKQAVKACYDDTPVTEQRRSQSDSQGTQIDGTEIRL